MSALGGSYGVIYFAVILTLLGWVNGAVFVPILQQEQEMYPDSSYKYSYATANGIMVEEQGKLKNAGTPAEAQSAEGFYTYLNGDGTLVHVKYVADEGGFQPVPNVVFRPALTKSSPSAEVNFQTYDALKQALRV